MSPRWNISKWIVKDEYKTTKFSKPHYLTKWGNFKLYQQQDITNGMFNKFCDMNKLHEQNMNSKK